MSETEPSRATLLRVIAVGAPGFQLRKGEEGISVFDPDCVEPPLTEDEILAAFRPGSQVIARTVEEVHRLGLTVFVIAGDASLPPRLVDAHREVRPSVTMTRNQFKAALKELE